MFDYLDETIQEFPKAITGSAVSPAPGHLFMVRDESKAKYLPEEQAISFHHSVAQLLFLTTRARRDIGMAVFFLMSRVKRPNNDGWGKLERALRYLYGTRRFKLILEVTLLSITKWFVDASHNAHWDCKGHGGAALFLGRRAVSS